MITMEKSIKNKVAKLMSKDEARLLFNRLFPLKYTDKPYNGTNPELLVCKTLAMECYDGFMTALLITGQIKAEKKK